MKEITVIKIGSSVLVDKRNNLNKFRVTHIAKQIVALRKQGKFVVLIISGAVAYGSNFLDLSCKQDLLKQAAAGVGQVYLLSTFNSIFVQEKLQIAQILLTKDSLRLKMQQEKLQNLIHFYLKSGFIPLINENDVLDLNSFGGNDFLAADVACLLNAKKMIMLSTMTGSSFGVGGGESKQEVINNLSEKDIDALIVNGKAKDILLQTLL